MEDGYGLYEYAGPEMAGKYHEEYHLRPGMDVMAEVNINIAHIKKIVYANRTTKTVDIDVAAKYLKGEKSKNIDFKESDVDGLTDTSYLLFEDMVDNHDAGGTHYGNMAIEPWDYAYANKLGFDEGSVVKYISRHKDKNGAEDVKKAISFCKHILKTQYGEDLDKG